MYHMSAEFCKDIPSWYVTENYFSPLLGVNPFCHLDEIELDYVQEDIVDLNKLLTDFRFDFKIDLRSYLKVSRRAIVVTDFNRLVVWTSFSFESMTGYKRHEVLNKNLNFLQRKKLNQIPNTFSQQLNFGKQLKTTVFNYKKNGTKYLCEIEIYPLFNSKNEITNFIAFETNLNK